ncbi:MAG: ribonuclease III domain-containing protein [Candidatus Thorarchaeota archaeon]
MFTIDKEKLRDFQEFIDYKFKKEELLAEALTTPLLGNEISKPSYEFLEVLGDSVIKIIFILKLFKKGITDPGEITKIKAVLESDSTLKNIANKMGLKKYIFKTEKQRIKNTRILADVFEALCGALFLDSEYNLDLVDKKMISPFYEDLDLIIQKPTISSKNELLEFLQKKFKTNIVIQLQYEKRGKEQNLIWIAKNPRVLEQISQKELIKLPKNLKSVKCNSKKKADKDIYAKILEFLKKKKFKI